MSVDHLTVNDLITELERAGVQLWMQDGRLRFRGPRGAMTDDLRERLRAQRDDVLAALAERDEDADAQRLARPDPERRHEPFPLTDVQAAYLLGRRDSFDYGGTPCQVYAELHYDTLDDERLEAAWNTLVRRHDMLRAVVDLEGHQRVLPEVPDYRIAVGDANGVEDVRAAMDHRRYDPGEWPMFELRISHVGDEALLHVSVDFLIADYLSIQRLLDELHALYLDDAALPELEIGFRDYLLAERRLRDSPERAADRDYWEQRIDELPPAPELPAQPPREGASARFTRHQITLARDDWKALQDRARSAGVTGSSAVLGAYAEVIGRWSRLPRFTLNLTVLNRRPLHPQVDALVGDFTSVNLLAVDRGAGDAFAERVRAMQADVWEGMDHRLFSGVEIMRELARRRGRAAALMPVVFTSTIGLQDTAEPDPRRGRVGYGLAQTPQVWIDCQAVVEGDVLEVKWDVREDIFPAGVIEEMFTAFERLLRALAAGEAPWEGDEVVPLPETQARRRREINATAAPVPDGLLHEGALAAAWRDPSRPAVIAGEQTLTHGEVAARALAVADALRSAGARPGELIAVVMEKGPEQVAGVLGTLIAGCAYLPVESGQPAARQQQILGDAGAGVVLTQSWLEREDDGRRAIPVDRLEPAPLPPEPPAGASRPADIAYVVYTSGSTGRPKGAMISHRGALNTVDDISRRFEVGARDRVLGLASLAFDLSVYDVFGTLAAGGCLVLPSADRRSDPSHWAQLVARHGVTVWNSVPAQLQMLEHYLGSADDDVSSLRLALLSGDWIPLTLPDGIRARIPGLRVISLGGATEASIWSIHHPIDDVAPDWSSIPYGRPLANQTFHVLDDELRPCPDWVAGELYIGGCGVALGYLGDEERTAERFLEHPETGERLYRTGDLGRYRPDGEIEFLGREDRQVKIRGHRIELAEVEAALTDHPAVAAGAVLVDGEATLDRRLAAFAEPARRTPPNDDRGGELERLGAEAGDAQTRGVDHDELMEFMSRLDRAAVIGMLRALRTQGLFAEDGDTHALEEILEATGAAPRHHRLVRRWLRTLEDEGLAVRDETGGWRALELVTAADAEEAWSRVAELQREDSYKAILIDYFRTSTERLPELLRDEIDPLPLLFPEGRLEISEAAYRDNIISRYVNHAAIAIVRDLTAGGRDGEPVRVLEVGAGVGGTTAQLVPALADREVDYLFTDVSQFFLTEGARRFAEQPWVRFGLFDINEDLRAQGHAPNSFDVILCANVLHNSRHAGTVLARLAEMLAPGGWLVFIETTRDSYQIMTSMEFMMPDKDPSRWDYEDHRHGRDQTFLADDEWRGMLTEAGADQVLALPREGDVTAPLGQRVFAARFKHDRAPLDAPGVTDLLRGRLPDYMIPSECQVVDAIPLTGNGKVDMDALRSWLPRQARRREHGGGEPRDELERRLAQLWSEVLAVPQIGRESDFFELGGDSLIVAKLAGRLRDDVAEAAGLHWDDLVRQILHQPTIAALAERLRDGAETGGDGAASGAVTPLVPLRDGAGPLRVLVHEGSGTLAPYRALIGELRRQPEPLAGLAVTEVQPYLEEPAEGLIERRAAAYARALEETGHSSFHIVGYCMGGLLATELARQLGESGADVRTLSVISSYTTPRLIEDELVVEYVFARVMGVDPGALGYPADERALARAFAVLLEADPERVAPGAAAELDGDAGLAEVGRCFQRLAESPQGDRLDAIGRELAASRPELDAEQPVSGLYALVRHSLQAVGRYEAPPYAGDITFLRQSGDTRFLPWLRDDMTAYWRDLCLGTLDVIDIPGDHFTCLQPPNVETTVERLEQALSRPGARA